MKELLSEIAMSCRLIAPYRYDSGKFIVERSLTALGVEITRKKQEMPVPYEEIEPNEPEARRKILRYTVRRLNELPFLATRACCQGHLYLGDKAKARGLQLDKDSGYLWGGWLSFLLDPRLPSSEQFFNRLASLTQQFSYSRIKFTDAEEWVAFSLPLSNVKYGLPSCVIEFDLNDFSTDREHIDPAEGIIVPRLMGQRRIESYDQFWQALSTITS